MADRLASARRRAFVGRADELRIFAAMLDGAEPATVLHVHGPGGVGKSALLQRMGWLAESHGRAVVRVDGREFDPAATATDPGGVLLFDEIDALPGRSPDVLGQVLSDLPADAVAVVAGRQPAHAVWRTDPGWRAVTRTIRLENLASEESRELLRLRGVPDTAHDAALGFTHGHPLALALLADVIGQASDTTVDPATPEVVAVLLNSLVGTAPSNEHLATLEACSQVAVTTEPLLAALLGTADARGLFNWLRDLAVIDFSPRGLHPHDIVRDALARELRWRDPEAHQKIHARARAYYHRQFQAAPDPATGRRILFDLAFLYRDTPALGPYLRHVHPGQSHDERFTVDPATPAEAATVPAIVSRHEGPVSAHAALMWSRAQPEALRVVRERDGRLAGLIVAPALDQATTAERDADPVAALAWADHCRQGPVRAGETVLLVRHWMSVETHQQVSPVQAVVTIHLVRTYLSTPHLGVVYLCCVDPDRWTDAMRYTGFTRVHEADLDVDGQRYGLFSHDWRAEPAIAWMTRLADQQSGNEPIARPPAARVLAFDEFAGAVRDALRDVDRPDRLHASPLTGSRLVTARAGPDATPADRARALAAAIHAAAGVLERSPRDRRGYRALHHTYLHPAPTQAAAAELLDLPTTTYRRHLSTGIARLTELLWQEELGQA